MEGPCGTGKTMAALTAAATLLRETDTFDNVFVATPVKQQRQQFIDDLRTINRGIDEPLAGVALVGKTDLCPYGREGLFPADSSVHDRCEDLRDSTADLIRADDNDGAGGTTTQTSMTTQLLGSVAGAVADDESDAPEPAARLTAGREDTEQWWDTERALELVRTAQQDLRAAQQSGGDNDATPLETAGASAPYGTAQPAAPEAMTEGESTPLYCPFEADWYARDKGSPVGFEQGVDHVLSTEEFLPASVEAGTCPHRAMGVLLEHADVVIGNYNHLFDSRTRNLTEPILDERTLVILDEAHRIEERVRDLVSDTVGRVTLKQAQRDLGELLDRASQHPDNKELVENHLAEHDVPYEAVEQAQTFYGEAIQWLDEYVDRTLAERFDGYAAGYFDELPDEGIEIELRDPETDERDAFTEWAENAGYDGDVFRTLGKIGSAVEDALSQLGIDRDCVCTAVGARFGQWWTRDHTAFFREITLDPTDADHRNPEQPWRTAYNASLVMYNCIPAEQVGEILGEFGGGVLMSATLEPLDVFEAVSGLASVAAGSSTGGDGDDRPARRVDRRSYDLQFPVANRESWIVDVEPFTARNRGDTGGPDNATRDRYAYVAREIARSHGNILLCYPNYAEAKWAAGRLREEIDKPVYLDESSSHETTHDLREGFVDDDHAVLVTSTRGTLTEGVDYEGDELHTCAVFGIPLVNIGSPRVQAVRHAYGDRFGRDNAFDYALTVPAVRQVRQAIGRVLRGPEERGVRILVGERYLPDKPRSVAPFFPDQERAEFQRLTPEYLDSQFERFWD
ncbi:ATP-dependent DNA helicase [Halonotius terrestris]|uniref:ATP-dependent DNA helicase n=2 Tax=Halonotius terrestris TaxID=2487750 RepID=A0A8J8PAW0_9EURY|nr:ATP-dependent DNA helicase [Halonotius terrestris]